MKSYKVIIAEDNTLLRDQLRSMLSSEADIEVVDDVENGIEAVQSAAKYKPDLMLMDLSMPKMNGIEAIREIRKSDPGIKFLVLTMHNSDEYATEAINAGANGYILKNVLSSELKVAVKNVLDGKYYFVRSGGLD